LTYRILLRFPPCTLYSGYAGLLRGWLRSGKEITAGQPQCGDYGVQGTSTETVRQNPTISAFADAQGRGPVVMRGASGHPPATPYASGAHEVRKRGGGHLRDSRIRRSPLTGSIRDSKAAITVPRVAGWYSLQ